MSQYAFSRADGIDVVAEIRIAELGKLSFLSVKKRKTPTHKVDINQQFYF